MFKPDFILRILESYVGSENMFDIYFNKNKFMPNVLQFIIRCLNDSVESEMCGVVMLSTELLNAILQNVKLTPILFSVSVFFFLSILLGFLKGNIMCIDI